MYLPTITVNIFLYQNSFVFCYEVIIANVFIESVCYVLNSHKGSFTGRDNSPETAKVLTNDAVINKNRHYGFRYGTKRQVSLISFDSIEERL